jgi:UDP-N-acetylmuramoyl-L-alanyl-D-glutamate--2,6-diaminopimelate ligase
MTLRELLGEGPEDVQITGLAFDNRVVVPGTLFFCVPGFTRDGHDFAPDAVARGAAALVVQRPLGLGVPEVVVGDVRAAMATAAARFYGDPTAVLRVVGITGTNGKTTTAFLLR